MYNLLIILATYTGLYLFAVAIRLTLNLIHADEEKRKAEQKRLISEMQTKYPVKMLDCDFESEKFYEMAKGLEDCRECGERCFKCYRLRLEKTVQEARINNFDYFTTTLTISPLKNADKIASICNDVVGDVAGVVSGSAGVLVASTISDYFGINKSLVVLVTTAVIASLTITGKAYGKSIAIKNSKEITILLSKNDKNIVVSVSDL